MPKFDASTPTIVRKFSDIEFKVPAPFAEGHALTANEATFLNSTLASVVGNQYSGDIRRALTAAQEAWAKDKSKDKGPKPTVESLGWDHAARFASKFADYELGVSNRGDGSGKTSADPVTRMVHYLATEELKARIAHKGLKVSTFYKAKSTDGKVSKFEELKTQLIAQKGDEFRAQAEALVSANTSEADDTADALLDSVILPEAETAAAAE